MREKSKVWGPEQEAREVEVPPGEHPFSPLPTALAKHSKEVNNKVGTHKAVHATTLAVEPPLNNTAPGA